MAKNKGGRPTKYKPEYASQAGKLCLLGATDAQLADFFGVSEQTITSWKKRHPEFLASLKEAKPSADEQVVQSLFKRARGCSVPDSDVRVIDGAIVITPLEKHFPPETAACMAWLHNRQPEKWRPRKSADIDPSDTSKAPQITIVMPDDNKAN